MLKNILIGVIRTMLLVYILGAFEASRELDR